MIDMHIHAVPPNLDGVGPLSPLLRQPTEAVAAELRRQMRDSGTTMAMAMGSFSSDNADPLGIRKTLEIAEQVPGLYAIGIANPFKQGPEWFNAVEEQIASGQAIALKAYLGYVHVHPTDARYAPYYQLAAKYKLPMIFHTGDTYSPYAKLKYAHPLQIDEVAVDNPKVEFVLAHVGNPWMIDAAEVAYKNMNVWLDISGLLVGKDEELLATKDDEMQTDLIQRLQAAYRYTERPNRFLYGTDWPLASMTVYRDLIRRAFADEVWEQITEENSRTLFRLKEVPVNSE